jgi:hypothetical protein
LLDECQSITTLPSLRGSSKKSTRFFMADKEFLD